MKHVSVLLLDSATVNSIDATRQLLNRVNDLLIYHRRKPHFNVQLVGLKPRVKLSGGLYTIRCDKVINEVTATDLIILPLVCGDIDVILRKNSAFSSWVVQHYKGGAEVASLCIASYILASYGLLDNKDCAIHWASKHDFHARFPKVRVLNSRIITDQDGIYTSGGTFTYLNLILYLIEKFVDREMSVLVSKMFEIEIERDTQAPYAIFTGQKNHGDEQVRKAQEFIEQNYSEKLTVNLLADKYAVGRRSFERRFRKATDNSVIEYIQRVRIEGVKKGVETGRKTIAELLHEVGYNDEKAFRDLFRKVTSLTPLQYIAKYRGSNRRHSG